jgi:cysteine desulfurase
VILYLDYNATAPVDPDVLDEMVRVYREDFGNASSRTHAYGQEANAIVERSRGAISSLLGIEKHEIIFTSGATESNNIAILGLAKWGEENGRRHIVSTTIEHKAVLEPLDYLARRGFEIDLMSVGPSGRVEVEDLLGRVRPDTLLVTLTHANNETGVVQPIGEIGEALAPTSTFFHVDAVQSFGKLVYELQNAHYDLLSISAHKIYGPVGIGSLVIRRGRRKRAPVQPLMFGGGQERGIRPGTLPVPLIAGFGIAAGLVAHHHSEWTELAKSTKDHVLKQLQGVRHAVNGDLDYSLPTCLNTSIVGIDSEALMVALRDSIAISNGSACTSANYKPSHVLTAMGLSLDRVESAIRLSWGPQTKSVDLGPLIQFAQTMQ